MTLLSNDTFNNFNGIKHVVITYNMIFSIWLMDGDLSDNMGCIKVFQLSSSTTPYLHFIWSFPEDKIQTDDDFGSVVMYWFRMKVWLFISVAGPGYCVHSPRGWARQLSPTAPLRPNLSRLWCLVWDHRFVPSLLPVAWCLWKREMRLNFQ